MTRSAPAHLRRRAPARPGVPRRTADGSGRSVPPVRPAAKRTAPAGSANAEAARRRGRRRLSIALSIAVAGALAGAGFAIAHSPLISARDIRIVGATHNERSAILAVSGLRAHPPLVDISPATAAQAIEQLPWVATAHVSVSFPSSVTVRITERVPVAYVALPRGGLLADASGRVLADAAKKPPGVVAVELAGTLPPPGGRLSPPDRALCAVAAVAPTALLARIAAISRRAHEGIVINLVDEPLVVFGSSASARAKFVTLATLLARASLSGVTSIDVRAPANPVLTP